MRLWPIVTLLLTGCVMPDLLPPEPELSEGAFRLSVFGWGEGTPIAFVPDSDRTMNLSKEGSLHRLDVSFNPTLLGLRPGSSEKLTATATSIPFTHLFAHKLQDDNGTLSWVAEANFDASKYRFVNNDPSKQRCAVLGACIRSEACTQACSPPAVVPPEPPQAPCPEGWVDTSTVGDTFCFPSDWVEADGRISARPPRVDCEPGFADFGQGCQLLSPCGTETYAQIGGDLSQAVFVNVDGPGPGSGTRSDPYLSLAEAWADGGQPIMIARGDYTLNAPATIEAGSRRALVGRCPSMVSVGAPAFDVNGGQLRLHGLSLTSPDAVRVNSGQLHLENTHLEGQLRAIIQSGGTVTASVSSFRVANTDPIGAGRAVELLGAGSFSCTGCSFVGNLTSENSGDVALRRSVLTTRGALEYAPSEAVVILKEGSRASLEHVVLHGGATGGVFADASDFSASDLRVSTTNLHGLVIIAAPNLVTLTKVATVRTSLEPVFDDQGKRFSSMGLRLTECKLNASDIAIARHDHGMEFGGESVSVQLEPPHLPELVVDRAWIHWRGTVGIWIRANVSTVNLSHMFMVAEPVADPFFGDTGNDRDLGSAIVFRSSQAQLNNLVLRPSRRNAVWASAYCRLVMTDVDVRGPLARVLWLQEGVSAVVDRLAAPDGSLGITLQGLAPFVPAQLEHQFDRDVHVTNFRLEIDPEAQRLAVEPALFGTGLPFFVETFDLLGDYTVTEGFGTAQVTLTNGVIELPPNSTGWPLIPRMTDVRLRPHADTGP